MNTRTDGMSAAGRPGLVCMLLLVAVSLEAEDRIGLRDGSSRGGALQSCSTDRCTLGGSSIPIREIAWIGLGQSKDTAVAIPPAGVDQVRLHDGTTREGSFVGISLGLVILEGAEMARSTVAWIRFADPKASAADLPPPDGAVATPDAVAMRDGSTRIGELVACVGGSCLIEGQAPVARASVAAIVFGGGEDQAIQSSSAGDQDRLMLRSGATHDGPVLAIDPEQVIAVNGTFARPSVAAVLFAGEVAPSGPWGAPPDPSSTGPAQPPVGGDPPPPTPPLPPPASPPPASPPPAPPGASPQGPRRGALWTGSCRGSFRRVDASCTARTEFTADLRLREWEWPLVLPGSASLERVGRIVGLEPEGSVLKNTYTLDCPESGSAAGSGTITLHVVPGQEGYLHPSELVFKDRESNLSYLLGVDLPLGGNLYTFSLSTLHTDGYPVTYRFGGSEENVEEHGFLSCMAGNYPLAGNSIDPEIRSLEGGRMTGQFSVPFSDGTYEASWSLCREGDDCRAPEPVDEAPADPCARPGAEAALRDTCVSQLDSMLDALAPGFDEYNALMKSVEIHRPGFEEAQTYCAVYDGTILILEAILSGGTGPAARAADALLYLRDIIEKAQDGDLASLLYPEEVKRVLDAHKKAKAAWFEMTADDLAKMQRDHGACSGKVPIETWAKANRFIEDLAAARRVWESDVAPGINDLRSQGLECAGLEHLAWRACFADAACRGVAPDCGPEPSLAGAYD